MTTHLWWYAARASGFVAWGLVTASMLYGVRLALRAVSSRKDLPALLSMHRFLGALAVLFTAAHVLAIVADPFVRFSAGDVLVPLASRWRPGPVAWGVVGLWLLAIVEGSSLIRRHMSRARWRRLHMLSYPLFQMTTVHMLSAGTDARRLLPRPLAIGIGVVLVVPAFWGHARANRLMQELEQADASTGHKLSRPG